MTQIASFQRSFLLQFTLIPFVAELRGSLCCVEKVRRGKAAPVAQSTPFLRQGNELSNEGAGTDPEEEIPDENMLI
ncbi:hypothetical protein CEXT_470551 [Caerostris extrusa]|uniref:Uncharacterized protein n=1 Tax=Caerostris extrusa TaxID=172846 RepID=A0AAV4S1X1_CAEEX|nr:hypothetical protein CEXT_470551 [Caerostris extrusa]